MAKIDSRNQRLEDYTQDVKDIKSKIRDIADNKTIIVESGIDTPLSVLNKINNGTIKTPTATLNITTNNTYDITNYANVDVNVQPTLQNKQVTITTNTTTTITKDNGYDGLNEVEVITNVVENLDAELNTQDSLLTNLETAVNSLDDGGYPIEIDNETDMNAVLIAANVGKVYLYTGTTTSNYTNGDIYIVEEIV